MTLVIDGVEYHSSKDLPADFNETASTVQSALQGVGITLTWTPENGVSYTVVTPPEPFSRVSMKGYSDYLSQRAMVDGDSYDIIRQRAYLNYTDYGLVRVRTGAQGAEYAVAATEDITEEFGTLYLVWEQTHGRNNRPVESQWVLKLYGVKEEIAIPGVNTARWDDAETFAQLAQRVLNDEGATIVQLALHDGEKMRRVSDVFIKEKARDEYMGTMVRSLHVSPTTVARKLYNSGDFGVRSTSQRAWVYRKDRTRVNPIRLTNGKVPVVVVKAYRPAEQEAVVRVLSNSEMRLHQLSLPSVSEPGVTVWTKDAEAFNGENTVLISWLNDEIQKLLRSTPKAADGHVLV